MQVQAASRSSRARRHSQAAGIPPPAGSARHRGGQAGAAAEARPPRSGYRRPLCRGGRAAGSWTGRAAAPCSARPGPAVRMYRGRRRARGWRCRGGRGWGGCGAGGRWARGSGAPRRGGAGGQALRPDSWVSASLQWRKIRLYQFLALKQTNPGMPVRLRVKTALLPTCQRPSHSQTHFCLGFAALYCRACEKCNFVSTLLPAFHFHDLKTEQVPCVEQGKTAVY